MTPKPTPTPTSTQLSLRPKPRRQHYGDALCDFCQYRAFEHDLKANRGLCAQCYSYVAYPRCWRHDWLPPPSIGIDEKKLVKAGMKSGLYASGHIEPNEIIVEFSGHFISRRRAKEVLAKGPPYRVLSCPDGRLFLGNDNCRASYANHSCSHNAVVAMEKLHKNRRKHRIFLVCGEKPIEIYEEITFNYGMEFAEDAGPMKCLCGSENCIKELNPKYRLEDDGDI